MVHVSTHCTSASVNGMGLGTKDVRGRCKQRREAPDCIQAIPTSLAPCLTSAARRGQGHKKKKLKKKLKEECCSSLSRAGHGTHATAIRTVPLYSSVLHVICR